MKASQIFTSSLTLVSFCTLMFFSSCANKDKEKVEPTYSEKSTSYESSSARKNVASESIDEILKTEGMSINPGASAPDISGEFQVDEFISAVAYEGSQPVTDGIPSHPYRFKIVGGTERVSIEMISISNNDQIFITDAYITGSGKKFTIHGIIKVKNQEVNVVFSGEADKGEIKGLEFAVVQIGTPGGRFQDVNPKLIQLKVWKSDRAVKLLPTNTLRQSPPSHRIFRKGLLEIR